MSAAPKTRREEVEAILRREQTENVPIDTYHSLALTLADEVDTMRDREKALLLKQSEFLRQHADDTNEIGQLTVEYIKADAVITKLLAMLEPGVSPPKSHTSCDCVECRCHKINEERHARACEIAGRKE